MRSKKEIVKECKAEPLGKDRTWQTEGVDRALIVELLADLRDEQVSLNKTLSAVLAGLLVSAQQGTPVKGEEISGAEAYGTPYTGGKKDEK